MNSDPEIRARTAIARAEYLARPETKEKLRLRIGAYIAGMPEEERQRRREHGIRLYHTRLNTPEVRAKSNAPEARAQAGRARSDTVLAWCPPELRDAYRALTRKGVKTADARRAIEAEIPGTPEHARRAIANHQAAQRLRAEREREQAY